MLFSLSLTPIFLIGGVFIWLIGLTGVSWWLYIRLKNLSGASIIDRFDQRVTRLEKDAAKMEVALQDSLRAVTWLKEEEVKHLQKLGILRFNPFEDTGGDQSFTIALLDGNNDGFVFSSLHGRAGSRIYAKIVKQGQPDKYDFSKEETETIRQAIAQKAKVSRKEN